MGKMEGAREGGKGLGRESRGPALPAPLSSAVWREISSFVHNQGRGFKALVKWFLRKRMYLSTFTWGCTFLQGDAGGLEIDYVDLDFQVPPVCTVALPIQQQPQQPSR